MTASHCVNLPPQTLKENPRGLLLSLTVLGRQAFAVGNTFIGVRLRERGRNDICELETVDNLTMRCSVCYFGVSMVLSQKLTWSACK